MLRCLTHNSKEVQPTSINSQNCTRAPWNKRFTFSVLYIDASNLFHILYKMEVGSALRLAVKKTLLYFNAKYIYSAEAHLERS